MAIWRGKSAVPSVGPEVHLKFKALGGATGYANEATEAVGLARIMLRQMMTVLKGGAMGLTPGQLQIMDYYFVMGGNPPSPADIDIIRQTLILTSNGLGAQGLNVKVTLAGSAMGYVNMHDTATGPLDKFRSKFGLGKKRWTPGVDVDYGTKTSWGDIHLDSDRLDTGPELSAKTLIHEATHKFASTTDFGERGYTDDVNGHFRANGLTHAEAMNNAESYARFVMMGFLFP